MTTAWECERCSARGKVEHPRQADAWDVVQRILDDHTAKSRGCLGGRNDIRCWQPERVHA